jgi:hypothetical protein
MPVEPAAPFFPMPREASGPLPPACCVVIDAEENFDWLRPLEGEPYSTSSLHDLTTLHAILDAYGAAPAYLLTYPVLMDPVAVRSLRRQAERGRCVLGLQLHTWVTPPLGGEPSHQLSYSSNLPPELEEQKLLSIKTLFLERFGFEPTIFRGGRYGFGATTASLLEKHGFTVDVSVAPRTDFSGEGGPDYRNFDCDPFWFGTSRRLLELPLCRSVVGWGGVGAPGAYRAITGGPSGVRWLETLLSRTHCAERVTLSPEGNDLPAMMRLARGLLRRRLTALSVSFHSSSMSVGGNPYVQTKRDLHIFYDRLSGILDFLASQSCAFLDVLRIRERLTEPEA